MLTLRNIILIIAGLFLASLLWRWIVVPLLHLTISLIPLAITVLVIVFIVGAISKKR